LLRPAACCALLQRHSKRHENTTASPAKSIRPRHHAPGSVSHGWAQRVGYWEHRICLVI